MSEYLEFKQTPFKGKTKKFEVISKKHGFPLGEIKWYGSWRQYSFYPNGDTIWNKDCLRDIQDFLQQLMDERKLSNKRNTLKGENNLESQKS